MRLSWNEIKARAANFSREWADAGYEKGETQSFYNDLFRVFGVSRRSVAAYEKRVERLDGRPGYIDLFWPGTLIVEQKSAGRSLDAADIQAQDYFLSLPEKDRPRYQLACDFQNFRLTDLELRETIEFPLSDLPKQVERLGFIAGVQRREFKEQDPVNAAAAHKMGELHDQLAESNYSPEQLPEYLVRSMFAMFGDDTGIWDRDTVHRIIEERTAEDGSDTGLWMQRIFQALGKPQEQRQQKMDEDLKPLPYVGGLFDPQRKTGGRMGNLDLADYDAKMRKTLLDACGFDWGEVSPIVFGTMFEDAMDAGKRRGLGAHYTSERNIRKVIDPLFMDDLRKEYQDANGRKGEGRAKALEKFHEKLGKLKFLDPACGCGNFLIVGYKCLRELEIDVIRSRRHAMGQSGQKEIAQILSVVDVDQFHGIEIGEFPAKIAEAGLWMMDHVMNNKLSLEFGEDFCRIPIRKHPKIYCADALDMDWDDACPAAECDFVMGNPPFIGKQMQTKDQKTQMMRICSSGIVDYVSGWFVKAGEYIGKGGGEAAFVSSNSVCQGEQPACIWPKALDKNGLEISFAHHGFPWQSEGDGAAAVRVMAMGMAHKGKRPQKRLFVHDADGAEVEYPCKSITPYLTSGDDLKNQNFIVSRCPTPMNGLPAMIKGVQPVDGGHLILDEKETVEMCGECPEVAPHLKPFWGAKEFLHGNPRRILHLNGAAPEVFRSQSIRRRLDGVRKFRESSSFAPTRKLSKEPTKFFAGDALDEAFLVVPCHTSEKREYVPIGFMEPPNVSSNANLVVPNADKGTFALLTSKMHNAWVRGVAGRLKSDIRYSSDICYNSFPLPEGGKSALAKLEPMADAVIAARADAQNEHPDITLAQMYDPLAMPSKLRKAHEALDKAVDKLYRPTAFPDDASRMGHLLAEYEKMAAPVIDAKHEAKRERISVQERQRRKKAAAQAKRVESHFNQGGKQRVRVRPGDTLPGLFDRPASSVNPHGKRNREQGGSPPRM